MGDIRALIADLPTYGYRRVHAKLRRQAAKAGCTAPNSKRVYRVMKVHGLLLQRHSSSQEERRHEGRLADDQRNTCWCSDALEIACDNGENVRVAFALDCCDREAQGPVATTGGIIAEDMRDLMVTTAEHRFGPVNCLASLIDGSTTTAVHTLLAIPAASLALGQ
ncbi:transposase InsO family protein [Novosphingobium chloroacetimidivorans]|uniref:Transposase InsO family protein n=1 Tax=Novosphingobium chloroacetimidivorans TaxID=1428314 RepID=A0A7W7NXU4_9SPHN|nr:IS3 family transposase [Novosphingobium chloroacetimidivorans]MBB4861038.1 transposase InsO family protein [Novosphingobium chloroacetimidivorans]